MRPILLQGHERSLTQVKYNSDGDIIFSVSKDHIVCAWYSQNGERLGTYKGHQGALWTVDVNPDTTLLASGGADNTMRLWDVKTGELLKTWDFVSSIKRVEFSPDGRQLLGVTEKRAGAISSIVVFNIDPEARESQDSEYVLRIVIEHQAKVTVAGFGFHGAVIIAGHEDGTVTSWDSKVTLLFAQRENS